MPVPVVMRSHNDMPLVGQTLDMLQRQSRSHELIVFDNASFDGTRELAHRHAHQLHDVPAGQYVPGRVLNRAMQVTTGEIVVFVNADCAPLNDQWLSSLLGGFEDENTAAVFGRQLARPDCRLLFAKDTEDTYGEGRRQARWRHCFSMAASAIRRSAWERFGFREDLQYSEDIDWTWRARQFGYNVRYVREAVVYHSHNYSLRQYYRRHYGEGRAEAGIFDWTDWDASLVRYSLLPFMRQLASDARHCLRRRSVSALLHSPALRIAQLAGRRAGFVRGRRERMRAS